MKRIDKIFNKGKFIIGMIHFAPLLGYPNHPTVPKVLKMAMEDLDALVKGGVDAIMVENNYDIPHKIFVPQEIVSVMTHLTNEIVKNTTLPVGVSVLWNDYKAALSIAKVCKCKYIRIPVFVDKVETDYGIVNGVAEEIKNYNKKIGASNILLFTDIHVKHSKLLSSHSIEESAKRAIANGSNALIITGKWTANSPLISDLRKVRKGVGKFPIIVGSGANTNNIKQLMKHANGAIVGTHFKKGSGNNKEINIKSFNQRISQKKVFEFMKIFKQV